MSTSINQKIGTYIHELCRLQGVSQDDIAHALHISTRAYERIEKGKQPFDDSDLDIIRKTLRISPESFINGMSDLNLPEVNPIIRAQQCIHDLLPESDLRKPKTE